jgi:UPF0716 protein FxsA
MPIALILFILVPIAEMWLLITVGGWIGALPTIGLVLLTAVIGLALLRQQGFSTFLRAQQRMAAGQIPAQEMGEGLFLAVGGALLLTPGFITDTIGFCCLIPGLRQGIMSYLLRRMRFVQMDGGTWQAQPGRRNDQIPPQSESKPDGKSNTPLEGEYRRED